MKSQDLFQGRYVLITGASAGLGEVFARRLAGRGANLILTARRIERLEELARDLSSAHGVRVQAVGQDLGTPGAAHALCATLRESGTPVDVLINNAGFGIYDRFWEVETERYEQMVRLNVEALTTLSRLLLPGMIERERGGIINLASTAAFQPVAGFAVYSASKAYVLTFTEALAVELKGTGVRAQVLCPGPTRTEFQSHSGTEDMAPAWVYESPEVVVDRSLRAFEAGKTVVVSGAANWLMTFSSRFFPRGMVATVAGASMARAEARRAGRK